MFFISHNEPEAHINENKSHRNDFEANFAVRLAQYLLRQEYEPEQVFLDFLFLIF
jgi:hypothetical protein